jgi:hypothetical protein
MEHLLEGKNQFELWSNLTAANKTIALQILSRLKAKKNRKDNRLSYISTTKTDKSALRATGDHFTTSLLPGNDRWGYPLRNIPATGESFLEKQFILQGKLAR